MGRPEVPDVSVLIPAYNAMPDLARCLDSVVTQSLGLERMEVVVIDDGSTDGTREEVDSWAARFPDVFQVRHAPGSGGPATPRNTALDLARGHYVFFLDADDFLGEEALERLLSCAEENGSDIVLGRMHTNTGRGVPRSMFRRTDLDADLFESRVYQTLSALKLFRRDLIVQNALRFPTHFPNCSDQPFTAMAYFRAKKISVLADYDYYFAELRDDNGHVTRSGSVANRLDVIEAMCDLLVREVPDAGKRGVLLTRHFQVDLRRVMKGLARNSRPQQEALLTRVAALVRTHLTPEIMHRLTPGLRVVYHLAGRELLDETVAAFNPDTKAPYEIAVEDGRVFAQLPYFRDSVVAVPDEMYDVTQRIKPYNTLTSFDCVDGALRVMGTAGFRQVASATEVEVVLRSRGDAMRKYVTAAHATGDDSFAASVDLLTVADGGPLPRGRWDVQLRVSKAALTRTTRLNVSGSDPLATAPSLTVVRSGAGRPWTATAFLNPAGRLSLHVGEGRSKLGDAFRDWIASWDGTHLVMSAEAAVRVDAPLALAVGNGAGENRIFPVAMDGSSLTARLPVTELPDGSWAVQLRVGTPPDQRAVAIAAKVQLPEVHWRTSLRRRSAASVGGAPTLVLQVRSTGIWGAFMRLSGTLRRGD